MTDPFRHHPELRDKIKPHDTSWFRTLTTQGFSDMLAAKGLDPMPVYGEAERETLRHQALAAHTGDLYIFAYGSLMWDPALDFSEVRTAHAPGHERRFILVDRYGGRGTRAAPGLMAALDVGAGCDGLAFRIPANRVIEETRILFQREMISPGYHARFIPVVIAGEPAQALTFLADHDSDLMEAEISFDDQVRYVATGVGVLGTSHDYLRTTLHQLEQFGIDDPPARAILNAANTM